MASTSLFKEAEWSISEVQAGGRAVGEADYFSALITLLRRTTDIDHSASLNRGVNPMN